MIRISMVFWLAAIAVAAIFLYELKHEVQDLEDQLAEVHGEILRDQEAIQVLKAEWSYLNRPSRIAELADRYLELEPIDAKQIATFGEVPAAPADPAPHSEEAAAPAEDADGIGTLIEAVVEEPAAQPAPAAPAQEAERQAPVNPVTGEPLPVVRQDGNQPAGGVGQPVQLIRTGAQQ
jgi:cell division protein FtsL